jgi:CRISPR type IV-associated DEAD/DEAH-box helicase Csf4
VADELVKIYDTAAGGCLVLMTSYASVAKVKNFLQQHSHIASHLIFAQQGEVASIDKSKSNSITVDEQRRKFLHLAFQGKKAIWLALGNAWTGINLSGGDPMKELYGAEIPANEDNVLRFPQFLVFQGT